MPDNTPRDPLFDQLRGLMGDKPVQSYSGGRQQGNPTSTAKAIKALMGRFQTPGNRDPAGGPIREGFDNPGHKGGKFRTSNAHKDFKPEYWDQEAVVPEYDNNKAAR